MGWLDANEVYVMETVARDRVDELRCAAHRTAASADGTGDGPGEGPESDPAWPPDGRLEICRGARSPRRLGAPGLAC